jgi:SAM-dependent methyltransferase
MEAYFLELAHNVKLHQSYSNYRVYNWQMPEPSTRSTLVDCGSLQRLDVRSLRECIQRSSRTFGFRWHLAGHDEFLNAASSEAETRIPAHAQSVLKDQIEGHAYLSTVAADEPLRADIQDFTHFIPSGLGRTLEIASGRGQLARVLSPRAVHYVCLELLPVRYDSPVGNTCLSVAADVHALPFAAESFDTIVANNILEHLYEPLAALRDLHRTLSAVGKLFALIPLDQLNPQHNIRTHLWKADADSIRAAFAAAGFQLERLETIDLYALGVQGCFPTCNGLVCKVEASKAEWSD